MDMFSLAYLELVVWAALLGVVLGTVDFFFGPCLPWTIWRAMKRKAQTKQ